MSLRNEQYRSLLLTRDFLRSLLLKKTRPKTIGKLQLGALKCLRHFPILEDNGKPIFSKDTFGTRYCAKNAHDDKERNENPET